MSLELHPLLDELNLARQGSDAHTATMTFAVYFEEPAIAEFIRERALLVGEKHQSRVIILDGTQPQGAHRIDATLVRGEWIEVGVRDADGGSLLAALSALALGEAPIVLAWIASRIASDVRFPIVAERAQTVICNSSVTDLETASLRGFIQFIDAHPALNAQDLAYLRIAGWQDVIAGFFDREEAVQELFRLREVEIAAGSEAEAYYLLGWLASRLNWSPCGQNAMCNAGKETVAFTIHRDGTPRRVTRVILRSKTTTFSAETMENDDDAICLEATGAHPHERRCAPALAMDIASLVERAILQKQRDPVFQQTLAMTKAILQAQDGAR